VSTTDYGEKEAEAEAGRIGNGLLYLSEDDVEKACLEVDPLSCVAQALARRAAGQVQLPDEAVLRWTPRGGGMARTLNMPGLIAGPVPILGTKIINASTENPSRGLPRAAGLTLLFNPVTARPEAILQGAAISARRTAAVSTLAARHLQPARPQVLGLIGAGPIAKAHAMLMAEHLEVERVLVCDAVDGRAAALARVLRDESPTLEARAVGDPEELVRGASIVVAATTTTSAYIRYEWIQPGSVVVNVSLDDVEEEAYLRADRLYVDDWGLIVADTQRLLGKLARAGKIAGPGEAGPGEAGGRAVDGTLGQLVSDACPGRDDDHQIILVNPFGMAIEDLAIASRVYEIALLRNYGLFLDG
jgi:N-[(2S)-2-amino-2-carboxyethyl]-L-glutamate dehydrogenase